MDGSGAKSIWAKPLAALAVMVPVWPLVWSASTMCRPAGLSSTVTPTVSPWFMNSTSLFGVKEASVESSGEGGPVGLPSSVTNA